MDVRLNDGIKVPKVFRPLLQPARYKGAHGGRGSGKSHFFAALAITKMATIPGFRLVCVREIQNSIADSVKQLLEDKIAQLGLGAFFRVTEREIAGINGSRCIFRGMQNHTADGLKSLEGMDAAFVEEAQTISQKSLDLLLPTIRKDGSELWFAWNPSDASDPVDLMLRGEGRANAIVIEANWNDNDFFPPALIEEMQGDRDRNIDKYLHVWQGQYRALSEARIFKNWRQGELNPPERAAWFYGVDFGFASDPTAALRCCVIGESKLYIDHEASEVGVPTEALPTLLHKVPDIHLWPSRADSARPETIDYLRRNGFPKMRGAVKGKGSVEDGIMFLQGLDIVVHPRCVNLLREFASYAYETDKRTGLIKPIPEDKNNHLIDALRYSVERLHRKGKLLPSEVKPQDKPKYDYATLDDDEVSEWKIA